MAFDALEPHIDDIIQFIQDGETLTEIGNRYSVSKGYVSQFLSSKHPARADAAYKLSAVSLADEAYKVLKDDTIPIDRGREIASHLRWEAKMRDRAKYGDKVEVENKTPTFTPDNFNQLLEIARNNARLPCSSERVD